MDLPYYVKKEEPVEYFLISTPDEEITVVTNFEKYSSDTHITEVHKQQIKDEPAELCLNTKNDQKNDPDLELNENQVYSESDEVENQKENDGEDWSIEKKKKRPKGKSRVKPKLKYPRKYQEISTKLLTCKGPTYTCTICSLTFPDEKTLGIHHRIHEGKNYQCEICNKVFRKKIHIYEHMKIHGEQKYSCPICEKTFAIKKSWINHKVVHEEKKFQCDICSARFRQKGHIWDHMKVHGERTKNYKCELCDMSYYEQRTLTRHMRLSHTKTPRKRFRCPNTLCDKSYSSVSSFKMHACVDGKRPESLFKANCSECGRWFYNKFEMNRHIKRIHINKVENTVCDVCNKIYLPRYWDKYVLHMLQNCAYPIMYTCDICSEVLPSKPKIVEHFADAHGIISGLINKACPKCDKKFVRQSKLNYHLKRAHDKYWNCEFCGKTYRCASGCALHQKFCMPKKIFDKYSKFVNGSDQTSETNECSICNRSFIKKIYLIEHMEVVHSEKKFEVKKKSTTSRKNNRLKEAFKCRKCNQNFIGEVSYKKHIKADKCVNANKYSNEISQYQCTICSKVYSRNCHLKRHFTKSHSQESGFYKCNLCSKKFSEKIYLKRHIEVGDHRTTFQCEECLKFFQRISAYKTHKIYCKSKSESKEIEMILS